MEAENLARSERLVRLQILLTNTTRGLTTREIAERCGVCRRTAQRDVTSLEKMGLPLTEDGGRYQLLPGALLPALRLQLEEATALFLAARLLCHFNDENNPWVARALEKLAAVLPPAVGSHVQRCAELASRGPGDRYSEVFRAITRSWARQRKVRIWYRAKDSLNVHDYVVSPYFIEPMAPGHAAYLIGHSSFFDSLRTFKLERIERAAETTDSFEPDPTFDAYAWLSNTWGVMGGGAAQSVVLRFSPAVARRVKESVWHVGQQLEECPDGSVLFTVSISEPREMVPWIRGWGPDVEVLGPPWLRSTIAADSRRAAKLYGNRE